MFSEAPGSLTFEMQDIPAIAAVAHDRGALVLMDNTWASPLYFRALEKGVDLSIQSATKYIGGHSDLMLGTVSANEKAWPQLKDTVFATGLCVGPDDMNLALRGLRTLGVRLARHHQVRADSRALARAAAGGAARAASRRCRATPGHAIWRRDFTGACGLFAVVLKPVPEKAVLAFLNALTLYGMGASWGGFESLAIPYRRHALPHRDEMGAGRPVRALHIGLEDVGDLIADLERGFAALAAAK